MSFFYLPWIVTRTSPLNSFPSKSFYVLSDIRLSSYIFEYFLRWSSWRFSTFQSNYWRTPLIPIDTISRAVIKVNRIFNNWCWVSYCDMWLAEVISRELWLVKTPIPHSWYMLSACGLMLWLVYFRSLNICKIVIVMFSIR